MLHPSQLSSSATTVILLFSSADEDADEGAAMVAVLGLRIDVLMSLPELLPLEQALLYGSMERKHYEFHSDIQDYNFF